MLYAMLLLTIHISIYIAWYSLTLWWHVVYNNGMARLTWPTSRSGISITICASNTVSMTMTGSTGAWILWCHWMTKYSHGCTIFIVPWSPLKRWWLFNFFGVTASTDREQWRWKHETRKLGCNTPNVRFLSLRYMQWSKKRKKPREEEGGREKKEKGRK